MDTLFQAVKDLSLSPRDFAIFGSGPLIVRGIIPMTNDLDIVCRGPAWEKVGKIGKHSYLEEFDVEVVTLLEGQISFGTKWGIGSFNTDELIDTAEQIDGLPFVRLEHVVHYKLTRASRKDLAHIEALNLE